MLTGTSPKVSIIMPAYNRAALILDTIESIRNQSYSNWELIIVDDGSSDNSGELITALSDEKMRHCRPVKEHWFAKGQW